MKLKELMQVINACNYLGIHEMIDNGNDYEMIYTRRLKTKEETERIMKNTETRK